MVFHVLPGKLFDALILDLVFTCNEVLCGIALAHFLPGSVHAASYWLLYLCFSRSSNCIQGEVSCVSVLLCVSIQEDLACHIWIDSLFSVINFSVIR